MTKNEIKENFELSGIIKKFPGIVAVNFEESDKITFSSGEIHGLVGENGAGKSTLVSIVAGIYQPTSGKMVFNGNIYSPENVPDARRQGVEIILQESGLVRKMSIEDNIFLGRENYYSVLGLSNTRKRKRLAGKALSRVNTDLSGDMSVSNLDIENQKMVELSRALFFNPTVIIVDEITAGLSGNATSQIYKILKEEKDKGKIIIYISHYLEEIFELCDKVSVLKDGKLIRTMNPEETNEDDLSTLMVGRPTRDTMYHLDKLNEENDKKEVVLSVRDLSLGNCYKNVSFDLHKGEILGIGGLLGCGNEELALTLFGDSCCDEGEIVIENKLIKNLNPRSAISEKIAYLPKDRDHEGLILKTSLSNNILLPNLHSISKRGFLFNLNYQKDISRNLINLLSISCRGYKDIPLNLSGGNRQKISLAKWLVKNCKVLILNNPTRGIDVGAKYEIYSMIRDLANKGLGIILISQELPELIGMCDNILIMRKGRIKQRISKNEKPTEEMLIAYMVK